MALPVLTTAEDVGALIAYLKTKPTGATINEAKAAIQKSVLDPRKFTAYTLWGFVNKEGERIKLTDRGWEFARKPEAQQEIYRRGIESFPPQKKHFLWGFPQKKELVNNLEVAAASGEQPTRKHGVGQTGTKSKKNARI